MTFVDKTTFKTQDKGLIIIYTGEGKGKTTAALGLALRAVGYKHKVLIVQFGKSWFTGEIEGIKKLKPLVKLIQGGKGFVKFMNDKLPIGDHLQAAADSYNILYKETISGKWDLVIADEIVGAVAGKMLTEKQVLDLIKAKPEHLDLVLTGHHADRFPEILAQADLVTEMKAVKHPYDQGFLAKPGIDY